MSKRIEENEDFKNKKSSIKLDYLVPRGGLEPPRREALTPEASVSTNSTTEACVFLSTCMVPRGGLEPPRREALTPEASVSTNSTTEAYAVDAVHIIRRALVRQQRIAK